MHINVEPLDQSNSGGNGNMGIFADARRLLECDDNLNGRGHQCRLLCALAPVPRQAPRPLHFTLRPSEGRKSQWIDYEVGARKKAEKS